MSAAIVRVLSQFALIEMFTSRDVTASDLKAWIARQSYSIEEDVSKDKFVLSFRSGTKPFSSIANDCNRMSQAAFESAIGLRADDPLPRSRAWRVIRAYYAAFFSAHALLRMYGISCSQLEIEHTRKVLEAARIFQYDCDINSIDKGFYVSKIDLDNSSVSFKKVKESHADTWNEFLNLVEELQALSTNAAATEENRRLTVSYLIGIKEVLTRRPCQNKGNWLSSVRNTVNYKQSHGVWFPYKSNRSSVLDITRIDQSWAQPIEILSISEGEDDIDIFFKATNMIVSLNYHMMRYLYERFNGESRILRDGVIRVLNHLSL